MSSHYAIHTHIHDKLFIFMHFQVKFKIQGLCNLNTTTFCIILHLCKLLAALLAAAAVTVTLARDLKHEG